MTRVIIFTVLLVPLALPLGMKILTDHERSQRIETCIEDKAHAIRSEILTIAMVGAKFVPVPKPLVNYHELANICAAEDSLKHPETN